MVDNRSRKWNRPRNWIGHYMNNSANISCHIGALILKKMLTRKQLAEIRSSVPDPADNKAVLEMIVARLGILA